MTREAIRAWLGSSAESYAIVVTALCLNVPVLSLVLARHLEGVPIVSFASLYAELVFVGYYALILFLVATALFLLSALSRRLAVSGAAVLFFAALTYLVVNSFVHRVYHFHVDAFWLEYLATSSGGLGAPASLLATGLGVVVVVAAVEWMLFRLARRLPHRGRWVAGFVTVALLSCAASQLIHIVAYHRNDARITRITPQLPFYYPVVSQNNAARYGELVPPGIDGDDSSALASLHYPLAPSSFPRRRGTSRPNILLIVLESWRYDMMDSLVSPRMAAFARRSTVFERHFSSGNSTPSGIFGLFYGIHPTYWTAVKANSALIRNPVLIDGLEEHGYDFGIYAESHFTRHKIKDAMFRGIAVHESFKGLLDDAKDADMTGRLLEFIDAPRDSGRPFFAFAFYKSTHYSYWYPPATARFRPSQKLNIALAGNRKDPTLFLNDYRNAIYYTDSLVGRVLDDLERTSQMDRTIVIITSDHGEEFNDNRAGYWGHTGNFTQYQTRVPLLIRWPGMAPRRITTPTAHVDIPATLIQRALGCPDPPERYSNGLDLFGALPAERPLVLTSYVNHGIILGDDVFAVYPMYVQKYKLDDIRAAAGTPSPRLLRQAMEEMRRFYGSGTERQAGVEGSPQPPDGARTHDTAPKRAGPG